MLNFGRPITLVSVLSSWVWVGKGRLFLPSLNESSHFFEREETTVVVFLVELERQKSLRNSIMESELESCNSDASTETYVMSPPPTIDSTGSAGSRSPSPGLVPGVLMEQSTIYRTPGGITVLTVNNPEELNIDLFIEAMVTLPPVSIRSTASPPLCLLRSRVEQVLRSNLLLWSSKKLI